MTPPVLFSTNCLLKLIIQERFRNDIHYVWCSETFDATKRDSYSRLSLGASSSNPASIYKELKTAIDSSDRNCGKIKEQKASFLKLASDWHEEGEITEEEKQEIAHMADKATFKDWRPLVYVIPRILVADRLQIVPPQKRASIGMEYIIPDLKRHEFELMEL